MSIIDHKCLACNAELKFDPKSQSWICNYCGSKYSLEDLTKDEQECKNTNTNIIDNNKLKNENKKNNECIANNAQENIANGNDTSDNKKINATKSSHISYKGYHCPDCGAEIVMDENTTVTECVYCGNTAIVKDRLEGDFKPHCLIPFKTTKDDAEAAFLKYKKGKIFMPKEFIQKKNIEKITGIYIPFYLHDMKVDSEIFVDAKKAQSWTDSRFRYTKTEYFDVYRAGNMEFTNIPTDASKKFPNDIMDSIEPFNYEDLVDFNASYMSGFLSEKYDEEVTELQQRAEERARKTAEQELLNDIGLYDTKYIRSSNCKYDITNESRYALLPVWMLNIKYNDKIYTLAMNGQTGKFIGNVPVLKRKVFGFGLAMVLGIFGIGMIANLLGLYGMFG